jgi:hypothetical protein
MSRVYEGGVGCETLYTKLRADVCVTQLATCRLRPRILAVAGYPCGEGS